MPEYSALDEVDPHGKDAHELGSKLDAGKPTVLQDVLEYFPDALVAVGDISAYGAKKYTRFGWHSVADGVRRYTEALVRHVFKLTKEEWEEVPSPSGTGPDAKLLHRAQIAWNALASLQLWMEEYNVQRGVKY